MRGGGAVVSTCMQLDGLLLALTKHLMRAAIRGTQRPSEATQLALRGHQRPLSWHSEAIRGHQRPLSWPSEAIRGHSVGNRMPSEAIRGHQRPLSGTQRPSEAIRALSRAPCLVPSPLRARGVQFRQMARPQTRPSSSSVGAPSHRLCSRARGYARAVASRLRGRGGAVVSICMEPGAPGVRAGGGISPATEHPCTLAIE